VLQKIDVPYVAGGRLLWETPLPGLRVGASLQALRLESNVLFMATATTVTFRLPAVLAVASAEYGFRDLLLAAEYSRWRTETQSSNPALIPESTTWSERAYALASYRLTTWLRAGAYYSLLFPNVDRRSGAANMQHDVAATLRFDINTHWLAKVEGHYMQGTAELNSDLNDNRPVGTLERNWAVLLVKTTAVF
jgi:predicted porin